MKKDGRRNNGTDRDRKMTWGKGTAKYCPKNKVCWSMSKTNKLVIYKELPSYGLERKEIPND